MRPSRALKDGLNFAVCVDGTNLSRMAFDMALLFAKPKVRARTGWLAGADRAASGRHTADTCAALGQDSVFCLHVENSDRSAAGPGLRQMVPDAELVSRLYEVECGKLVDGHQLASASVTIVPKTHSVKEHIMEFVEKESIDVVVMGSVEL